MRQHTSAVPSKITAAASMPAAGTKRTPNMVMFSFGTLAALKPLTQQKEQKTGARKRGKGGRKDRGKRAQEGSVGLHLFYHWTCGALCCRGLYCLAGVSVFSFQFFSFTTAKVLTVTHRDR